MTKNFLIALLSILTLSAFSQEDGPVMADAFRENGKIYVVITVIGIIFASLLVFLVYLERKLKNLEDEVNKRNTVQ
jgi:hypothetical protein